MLCLFVAIALLLSNGFMLSPAFAQDTAIQSFNPQELLRSALKWVASLGYIGGLVFIFIYIVSTVAFIPGSILTLGAGVLFGVVLGSLYVFVGATLGAI
ncbi:MAG: TVP38/TMEM64 family protein, partial [Pseudanabaena sp.]